MRVVLAPPAGEETESCRFPLTMLLPSDVARLVLGKREGRRGSEGRRRGPLCFSFTRLIQLIRFYGSFARPSQDEMLSPAAWVHSANGLQ